MPKLCRKQFNFTLPAGIRDSGKFCITMFLKQFAMPDIFLTSNHIQICRSKVYMVLSGISSARPFLKKALILLKSPKTCALDITDR